MNPIIEAFRLRVGEPLLDPNQLINDERGAVFLARQACNFYDGVTLERGELDLRDMEFTPKGEVVY